jgi:hypothetical protein
VDGTNARLIVFPDGDYVLGAREELLYARGDRIANPKLGIVDALRGLADRISPPTTGIRVLYLEVYGGKITRASKQYTGGDGVGYRLFDAVSVASEMLDRTPAALSSWRDSGGQQFHHEEELASLAVQEGIELTPRLGTVDAADLPSGIEEMQGFLTTYLPATHVALDPGAGGQPEGIVLRAADRSVIAKARFQNYQRTLRR